MALSSLATGGCGDYEPGTGCDSVPLISVTLPLGAQESLLSFEITACRNGYCRTIGVDELDGDPTFNQWFDCFEVSEWGPEAALCIFASSLESGGIAYFLISWEVSKDQRSAGDTYVTTIRKAGTEVAEFTDIARSKCSTFRHVPDPAE